MGQSMKSQADTGWASGHHSYPKGHGGGNKVGATTHAPKEWGSKARKEEERLTGLARQAELDAIAEGLAEAWGWRDGSPSMDDLNEEYLSDAYVFGVTGVTLNGEPFADDWYDDYDYEADRCPHCGSRIY
jgi:hypothetical protein